MIQNIFKFLFTGLAVMISAYIIPGVVVQSYFVALVAAVMIAILNIFVKPLLIFLSLPINILTLGLFTFVINSAIIAIAAALVPGFEVNSFWDALLFSILLSLITAILHKLII